MNILPENGAFKAATMASVMRGIKDIKEERVSELNRDFSEFLNDDEI